MITHITDLHGGGRPGGCVSAANNALYFGWQGAIIELDLDTLEERTVWEQSPPMRMRGRANPTANAQIARQHSTFNNQYAHCQERNVHAVYARQKGGALYVESDGILECVLGRGRGV